MAQADRDQSLLEQVACGDKAAMHTLYERYHDTLFAFICLRCNDEAMTRDIVHDTMLAVWRGASRFNQGSSVKTWIFAIGRNKMVDQIRKSSQISFVEQVPDVVDDSPNPDLVIEASQNAFQVHECLSKLTKTQCAVIRLAFFDNMTYEEIALVENIPVGTVKSRIFHAKKALMHYLGSRS